MTLQMQAEIKQLRERIEQLEQQVQALTNQSPKRGRPPKDNNAATN